MKVYLSATMDRVVDMRERADQLELHNIEVTSSWHATAFQYTSDADAAETDMADILRADVLVFFTEDVLLLGYAPADAHKLRKFTEGRGGRHFELGYALAHGKRCYVVGETENVFHALPAIERHERWSSCLTALVASAREQAQSRRDSAV